MRAPRTTRRQAICGRQPATHGSTTRNAVVSSKTVGYGESVVELDRDLNVVDWSRPEGIPFVEDNDFGAAPLLFQPPGCPPLAAANAKNGRVYVWFRDDLGGGALLERPRGPDELGRRLPRPAELLPGANMFFIADARDYNDEGAIRAFDAVVAFTVGNGCAIPARPTWTAPGVGRGPKTPPLVVGDVMFVPGGFDHNVFALDARTGKTLWSSSLPGAVLAPITWAQDKVLVGDSSGTLHAFGLVRPARRHEEAALSSRSARRLGCRLAASSRGSRRETTCETRVLAHRHAVKHVGSLHRPLLVRDDDELRPLGEPAQEIDEAADVRVVERRLHLVRR